MHAQYFALINLNLKLQFKAKASFSLFLILLDQDDQEDDDQVTLIAQSPITAQLLRHLPFSGPIKFLFPLN